MIFHAQSTRKIWQGSKAQDLSWAFLCLVSVFGMALVKGAADLMAVTDGRLRELKVLEELSSTEKEEMVQAFLAEGDEYFGIKDYDRANAAYERVFVLSPNHPIASRRIDRLKKQMLAEGKTETEFVTHIYDAEIEARTHYYMRKAAQLAQEEKLGQARFTIEKLLLIDPLHKEAAKLYEELKQKSQAAQS